MGLSTQSAANLAEQCVKRFDQTLEIPSLAKNQWAENRRADFSLLVDGVGARARQHASLDSRLESREHELALIKTIFLNLKSYLGRCLTAVEEEPLKVAKQDVDAAIDNLALIAVAIRQAGKRSRLSKADRSFDRATLVELEIHLTCMALLRRTSFKEEFPTYHEDDAPSVSGEKPTEHLEQHKATPDWWRSEIDGEITPLQDRLIEANLRRRNRFLYAQRHSRKLAIPQAPAKEPVAVLVVPDREDIPSPKQIGVTHRQVPNNDLQETENFPALAPTSLTHASEVDSNFNLEEPKIAFQVSKTQITSITGATEYPKLRKPPVGQSGELDIEQMKIQKCPCCCEALPRAAIASKNAWKKHLSGDVRPYTCISDNCPSPFALHSTRAEWEDHMKKEHPKKWKCQLCDSTDSSLFSKVDELVEHVRRKHTDSFLEEDLEAVQL
ncbi:unnamed protein product [Clonostachys rhizophaga]|uniref:C2H2-type domain-containing protein n=1 Tax=Clonostachys rhizophaga TaxID=160324 RepID=A0A9N9VSR4_9HYPO|nr:unnamed protein product [Clonostachys rhizophaga]